jgi:arsenite-transporting ATPase
VPQLTLFIGKGGVGKTTISSAFAARHAATHPRSRVLLISTDPAHSLADVFQVRSKSSRPVRVAIKRGNLALWQIEAKRQFDEFLHPFREQLFDLLESGTIFSREEIEPLLSTALPGVAEMAALIGIAEALESGKHEQIVVDTAPMGHTLRLLTLPEQFLRFLDFLDLAASRDQALAAQLARVNPVSRPFLEGWRKTAEQVRSALQPASGARIFLVTTAEEFSLNEALRAKESLAGELPELRITDIVLNRALGMSPRQIAPQPSQRDCRFCSHRLKQTAKAKRFLQRNFQDTQVFYAGDSAAPVLGAGALTRFGAHVFGARPLPKSPAAPQVAEGDLRKTAWPKLGAPLVLTVGKGGVGKTTVSAALAFHQRNVEHRREVIVASTDPAPSLDDIFRRRVGDQLVPVLEDEKLLAVEFDALHQFQLWAAEMKQKVERAFGNGGSRGVHIDLSFDRRIIAALLDIVPPGVDEILAIFRVLDLLKPERSKARAIVLDMAPTGHALELLRMPQRLQQWSRLLLKALAPHRAMALAQDLAVEVAQLSQRVRNLTEILKDGRRCQAVPVMLAEPLPDRQTVRLLKALEEMGLHVPALFVNRLLREGDVKDCEHCRVKAAWQRATLAGSQTRFPGKVLFVTPDQGREVCGRKGLQSFTRELWLLEGHHPGKRKRATPAKRMQSRARRG